MNRIEKISTVSLASIFGVRMLGIFMILPVFSLFAQQLKFATPELIGVSLGIYGLTQAFLQIPFGFLSDRVGRKPIIFVGLSLFILGSIIAAVSDSIYGVMIGRALQGCAAIGSVTLALLADLVRPEKRSQSMAMVGIVIAITFSLSLILGPLLSAWIGVRGIFWLSAILGGFGIIILGWSVPTPPRLIIQADAEPVRQLFKTVLTNRELLRLDVGIFVLHAVLTGMFVVLPILLTNFLAISEKHVWWLYLPVILLAFICALFFISVAEKRKQVKGFMLSSIVALGLSISGLICLPLNNITVGILLWVFFTAFTVLEASLPATVSKLAPPGGKGTALGVYSTLQFLGIFIGGSVAGALFTNANFTAVFGFCTLIIVIWLGCAAGMKNPE